MSVSFCLFVCFLTVVQICSEPEQDLECFGSAHLLLLDGLCLWGWGAGSKTRDLEGAPVVTGSPEYMGSSGIHICAPPECAGSIPHQVMAPKSLQMVTAAMKLKDAYSLEGKL